MTSQQELDCEARQTGSQSSGLDFAVKSSAHGGYSTNVCNYGHTLPPSSCPRDCRRTQPRPCFSPGGHDEKACLLRRCSPRSWSQPTLSITVILVVWPGWELPWESNWWQELWSRPPPRDGHLQASRDRPRPGQAALCSHSLHVPSVGVTAHQPGKAAVLLQALPSGAGRSWRAGGRGGWCPLPLAV